MKCVGFCRLISHHYPLNCSIMYQVCPASGRRYLLCFDIPIIWMDVQDEITARPYENTQTVTSTTVLPLLLLIMQVLLHLVDFCWIGSWFCKFKDWKECISDFVMHSVGCSCVKMFAFWVGEKKPSVYSAFRSSVRGKATFVFPSSSCMTQWRNDFWKWFFPYDSIFLFQISQRKKRDPGLLSQFKNQTFLINRFSKISANHCGFLAVKFFLAKYVVWSEFIIFKLAWFFPCSKSCWYSVAWGCPGAGFNILLFSGISAQCHGSVAPSRVGPLYGSWFLWIFNFPLAAAQTREYREIFWAEFCSYQDMWGSC